MYFWSQFFTLPYNAYVVLQFISQKSEKCSFLHPWIWALSCDLLWPFHTSSEHRLQEILYISPSVSCAWKHGNLPQRACRWWNIYTVELSCPKCPSWNQSRPVQVSYFRPTSKCVSPVQTIRTTHPISESTTKELMLLNYGVGEDTWESLGQQG